MDQKNANYPSKCTANGLAIDRNDKSNVTATLIAKERNVNAKNEESRDRDPDLHNHVCVIFVDLLGECSDGEQK